MDNGKDRGAKKRPRGPKIVIKLSFKGDRKMIGSRKPKTIRIRIRKKQ